jgi:DNA-binding transcriptional LysR family regulator
MQNLIDEESMNHQAHFEDVPDLSPKQLRAIVTIAEYGSVSTAASALDMSQPALSRILQRVERVLGIKIFARSTRSLEITPAGREVIAVAERMLNDLKLTLRNVGELAGEQRGQVIVSAFPTFALASFPRIVRQFRQSRPNVVIHLRRGCNTEILEDVSRGIADFGVLYVSSVPETIKCVRLREDPLFAVLPWNHPLGRQKDRPLKLNELRDVEYVSMGHNSHTQRLVDGAAAKAGFSLRSVVVAPGFQDVLQFVRAGVGVGIMPAEALPRRRDFVARELSAPALSMTVGLISLRDRHLTPVVSRLLKMTTEALKGRATAKSQSVHGRDAA